MKITQKAIELVIRELIGEDALPLVEVLKNQSKISEFQISTKIKTPVDVIRNQLYRLYNHNLVTFIRKKDKKKGWYIYYWSLNTNRLKYLISNLKKKRVEKLHEHLSREEDDHFFACENSCIRVDFEQATNFEYRCPECGELLHQEDNSQNIEKIKKEIKKLEKEIDEEKEKLAKEEISREEEESKEKKEPKTKKTKTAKKTTKPKKKSKK